MANVCKGLVCEHSFRDFNRIFANGVPPEIAAGVSDSNLTGGKGKKLYGIDMCDFDAAVIKHFEKDWLGKGGKSWFGADAGKLLYSAFVHAIKSAGSRQIKAIWVENDEVEVQTIQDENLVLVILGAPRARGGPHSGGDCGQSFRG